MAVAQCTAGEMPSDFLDFAVDNQRSAMLDAHRRLAEEQGPAKALKVARKSARIAAMAALEQQRLPSRAAGTQAEDLVTAVLQ